MLALCLLTTLLATASAGTCSDHYLTIHSKYLRVSAQPATFGSQSGSASGPLVLADPPEACTRVNDPGLDRAIALVTRGSCTFQQKALMVEASGFEGVIVRNNASMENEPAPCMNGDESGNSSGDIWILAASVTREVGKELEEVAEKGGLVTMRVEVRHPVLSSMLLWLIAVGTLVWGSWWSGLDYSESKRKSRRRTSFLAGEDVEDPDEDSAKPVILDVKLAVLFVGGASFMLLLLYLLLSQVVYYILLGGFVLGATQGLSVLIASFIAYSLPWCETKLLKFGQCGTLPLSHTLAMLISFAICVLWAVFRNSPGSWLVQDVIGVSLLVFALRIIRVPSLKVATVMLTLFLMYDVFWVFLQPLITPNQKSIMVDVATAKGLNEYMPIVLRVPSIWSSGLGEFSILGYGDVIMPGLLVAYTRRLDLCMGRKLRNGYYIYCVCGYGLGLLVTYGAQFFKFGGSTGQPALLYLVPCTLGVVSLLAVVRSEFCLLMSHTQKDDDSEDSRSDTDIEHIDEVNP